MTLSGCRSLGLALALAFASGPATAGDYVNTDFGFRVSLPTGWSTTEVSSSADALEVIFTPTALADRAQLKVKVNPPGVGREAEAAVKIVLASVKDDANHTNAATERRRIGEHEAAGLVIDNSAMGQTWRVRQAYMGRDGVMFQFQDICWPDEYDRRVEAFDEIWDTVRFTGLGDEQRRRKQLNDLAARCGSEVDWAADWDEAERRARTSGRPILASARVYPGFAISDERMSGFFMDQDVIALLDERFVPLLVDKSTDAPFVDEDVYGLSNYTFGTAMLVVSPKGEVLLDTYAHVEELLREALAEDERLAGPPAERLGDRLAQAQLHARRGELDAADQLLAELLDAGEAQSPDVEVGAWRLRARLATRRRDGPEALDALARAREVAGVSADRAADPALAFELDLDEVPTLVGMGDSEQAVARLDVLLADTPEHPRLTEAIYMRGALARYVEDKDVAQGWLEKLVLDESLADDRWAWMAAATLTSTAWSMEIPGALGWPEIPDDHDALALVRPPVYEPLPAREAARAEQDALEYLLATQKDDGSWPYRTDFMRENDRPADDFQLAIAAICIQGLLPHRDDPRVDDALERAIAWVLPADDASAAADEPNYFMDYSVWSRPYLLWLLADLLDHQLVERARAETMAERLCRELQDLQKPEGGWSYYLTGDIDSASPAVLVSMSFTTAVNVLALVRAQEAGLAAPSDLLARGLDSLESARSENGLFEYMVGINADRSSWRSGSAGRGPLCNLALERGERGVDGALEESLDDFVEFRGAYEKETGKALMHTGPEAEGSHWLMFDYAYAAVAADSLPPRKKRRFEKPLLEMLLRARTSDGAYVDNPLLGSVFGAGMALVAFDHLLDDDDT